MDLSPHAKSALDITPMDNLMKRSILNQANFVLPSWKFHNPPDPSSQTRSEKGLLRTDQTHWLGKNYYVH